MLAYGIGFAKKTYYLNIEVAYGNSATQAN
jgi:hypothetical protein